MAIDERCHAIDELNIYTRLCEILNIYIWGGIRIWGDRGRERWGEENAQKKRDTIKISLS